MPHELTESLSRSDSIASIDRPPSEEQNVPTPKVYRPYSIHVLSLLAPASIFGVLARLGLSALTTYDGQSIFPLAYSQALGCFVMGACVALKEPLGDFYGPLYTAISTGFCGSLTTFSGWQLDVFNSWVNAGRYSRGGLRDFIDGLAKTVFTLSLALASVAFGYKLVYPLHHKTRLTSPSIYVRYSLTILAVLMYAATLPAYFRLPPSFRHQATAALLFSYPGTLTRYFLSINLNPRLKSIPLGTLVANMLGTALVAAFHVLQNKQYPNALGNHACSILQGLIDGYCGCLTTVSTFAVEVRTLGGKKGAGYTLLSWVVAQLVLLVIMGPIFWASGVSEQQACRFE